MRPLTFLRRRDTRVLLQARRQPRTGSNARGPVAFVGRLALARGMTNGVEVKLWQDAEWLRRLALALARDASSAEDLVQEVWLTALGAQPRFKGSARPWLAKVARNLVRPSVRTARSHDRWERLSNEVQGLPSPEALLTEQEALRILRRLLSGLDEPYRSTILLCYGDGLTPTEAARPLGLAPGTPLPTTSPGAPSPTPATAIPSAPRSATRVVT
jgi:RNA polymerase sigma factor (sigma-70 family)